MESTDAAAWLKTLSLLQTLLKLLMLLFVDESQIVIDYIVEEDVAVGWSLS